ncbi:MAG TPA: cytidylate kinase-like family protein [Tepidisphaeraceae bacterium]|nr:cytidylate kinase-like family protein [Tepidisphaeraceae bacterium]
MAHESHGFPIEVLRGLLADVHSEALHETSPHAAAAPPAAFITISRQTGAGASTLAEQLVPRLNALDHEHRPWSSWDRELVEKIAIDHQLSRDLVENLGQPGQSWVTDFLAGLKLSGPAMEEAGVYHRVIKTVRALATAGRVILVGRGAVFVTKGMPGGIHVRLVAPIDQRIDEIATRLAVSREDAARYVRAADAARRSFYMHYWPNQSLEAESFSVTFNTAVLSLEQISNAIISLIVGASGKLGSFSDVESAGAK